MHCARCSKALPIDLRNCITISLIGATAIMMVRHVDCDKVWEGVPRSQAHHSRDTRLRRRHFLGAAPGPVQGRQLPAAELLAASLAAQVAAQRWFVARR